jgi:hypothetical protein
VLRNCLVFCLAIVIFTSHISWGSFNTHSLSEGNALIAQKLKFRRFPNPGPDQTQLWTSRAQIRLRSRRRRRRS